MLVVLLIAFLVVGPKDLPNIARWLGRSVKKIRLLIREIRQETGWDDIEKEIRDTKEDLKTLQKEADITSELESASGELNKSLKDVQQELDQTKQAVNTAQKDLES